VIRRLGAIVAVAWLAAVAPLAAQTAADLPPWRLSWFPYFTVSPNSGLMGIAHAILFRQADYADRVSLREAVMIDAGYSTRDAWLVRGRGDFPRIADGWRLQATAEASHAPRFGDPDSAQELSRQAIAVEVTRRIAGPLQLAVRGGGEHVRDDLTIEMASQLYPTAQIESPCFLIDPLPGSSCTAATLRQTDVTARAALVLDLRDREFNTLQGALLEGGIFTGSAAEGYHGVYALARGWYSPGDRTHFTGRVGLRATSSSAAVGIGHTVPGWERPFTTFGGAESERGLAEGRYTGRGLLLGAAEVRQDVVTVKDIFAVSLLAFVDGGRAFRDARAPGSCEEGCLALPTPALTGGNLRFTLDDWIVSGGGGVGVRVLRNAILTVTAARGEGRTRWYVSSGWSW
jgi:hypothetical protein